MTTYRNRGYLIQLRADFIVICIFVAQLQIVQIVILVAGTRTWTWRHNNIAFFMNIIVFCTIKQALSKSLTTIDINQLHQIVWKGPFFFKKTNQIYYNRMQKLISFVDILGFRPATKPNDEIRTDTECKERSKHSKIDHKLWKALQKCVLGLIGSIGL